MTIELAGPGAPDEDKYRKVFDFCERKVGQRLIIFQKSDHKLGICNVCVRTFAEEYNAIIIAMMQRDGIKPKDLK